MKSKNIFWGIFFVVASAFVIVNQLGYFENINLFSLICTIVLIPIIIKSIAHTNFGGILFPLALLGIIYAEPLGITALTPWPILATALFGTIGLTLIFHKNIHHWHHGNGENFSSVVNTQDESSVDVKVSFNASIKYINTEKFKNAKFKCSFGALKVFFDNAKVDGDSAEIYLDISFSGAEFYIPKEWMVINNVSTSFGAIEEKNARRESTGPKLILTGNVSFGGVEIIYI